MVQGSEVQGFWAQWFWVQGERCKVEGVRIKIEGGKVLKSEVGMRPSTSSDESKGERKKDGRTAHGSRRMEKDEGER
jgi:hypothetical protein